MRRIQVAVATDSTWPAVSTSARFDRPWGAEKEPAAGSLHRLSTASRPTHRILDPSILR